MESTPTPLAPVRHRDEMFRHSTLPAPSAGGTGQMADQERSGVRGGQLWAKDSIAGRLFVHQSRPNRLRTQMPSSRDSLAKDRSIEKATKARPYYPDGQ